MIHRAGLAGLVAALALAPAAFADDVPAGPAGTAPAKAPTAAAEQPWAADFDAASAEAKKQGKDLFIDFTGSDWCGWCIKLHDEVFSHEAFLAAARKEYVLVALDFPRAEAVKAKVPNPARNAELAQKYRIQGYPTVLLMTADGEVFGRTGYQPGGPEKYVEHIGGLRKDGMPALKESKELSALIASAKGPELAAACEKAIAALSGLPEDSGAALIRAVPVQAAFATDPENKTGLGAKAALALLKFGAADEKVIAAAETFDPKNEQGILERVVQAKASALRSLDDVKAFVKSCGDLFALGAPKDKKVGKQLAANCMFMYHQHLKDPEMAKTWAKRVQEMGFEPGDERLQKLVEQILGAEAPKTDK